MEGLIVDGRARELRLELDGIVGNLLNGWRGRVGGLVAVDVGRGAAGVFGGCLGLWRVGVLAGAKGFPDAGSMEFGIFYLLEGLGGVSVAVWLGSAGCIRNHLWVKFAEDFADFEESRPG